MKVCNFCGKLQEDVPIMITSTEADICSECVTMCMEIIIERQKGVELEFNKEGNYGQSKNLN